MKTKFSISTLLLAVVLSVLGTTRFVQPAPNTTVRTVHRNLDQGGGKVGKLPGHVAANVHYKMWDPNAKEIEATFDGLIPRPFLPHDQAVWVESMPLGEFLAMRKVCYPDDDNKDLPRLMGEYLDKANPVGDPNLPAHGGQIYLVKGMSAHEEKATLAHEYGHRVFFVMCTNSEQDRWTAIWNDEEKTDDHPTLYSATNDSEGFAESFMLYCTKDPDLSHRSFKYFHDLEGRLRHDAASGYSTDSDDE